MDNKKVLIVDDDEALLHMMMLAVRRSKYPVSGALCAADALKVIKEEGPFAVMVTDLMMPDMNGVDLMRQTRLMDARMQVIMITAAASLETAISSLRAEGAYDYLLKPLESMDQLTVTIERALGVRRLRLEREALYAQVQADAERLGALIANTGDAIFSADENGVLTIANPAAARLLNSTQKDLTGQPISECLPAPLPGIIENWQAVSSHYPITLEVPWDTSVQMVNLTPLMKDGAWKGWVMVLRDITHFKKLDDLKAQMLSEAADKIRYPLVQAVNALAELDLLSSQDERVAGIVYRLTKVWGRIQEWVDDLPTMMQLDAGLTLKVSNVNLSNLLDEITNEWNSGKLRDRGLSLITHVEASLPLVRADAALLRQLVNGLVNRAMMRSKRGNEIVIRARAQRNQVWVDVSDDGPAVSETDLPHLFEKSIVRLDSNPDNTGLELPLAKAILDRIGGQVWIGGQGPVGSTVTICLPTPSRTDELKI
ncbi:MAG: response regulator [Chloroflexota bacterium]